MISELLNLFYNYGDRRLADAIDAIVDLGLIDEKGNWRRVNTGEGLTEAIEADVKSGRLTLTSAFLDQGYTLRIAAAKVAAEGEVAANSFDAAVKQITREWRSAGLQPGQSPSAKINFLFDVVRSLKPMLPRLRELLDRLPVRFNDAFYGTKGEQHKSKKAGEKWIKRMLALSLIVSERRDLDHAEAVHHPKKRPASLRRHLRDDALALGARQKARLS